MTVFYRLVIVLALSLPSLQATGDVLPEDACYSPVETSLKGDTLSNIVQFADGITSHPLGSEVDIVVPTSIASRSGAKLSACIRWQPMQTDSDLKLAVVDAIDKTIIKIKDAMGTVDKIPENTRQGLGKATQKTSQQPNIAAEDGKKNGSS